MRLQAANRLKSVCASCGDIHADAAGPDDSHVECTARRSQEWFTKLEESAKKDYVKRYPGSQFLRHPDIDN